MFFSFLFFFFFFVVVVFLLLFFFFFCPSMNVIIILLSRTVTGQNDYKQKYERDLLPKSYPKYIFLRSLIQPNIIFRDIYA